MIVGCGRSGTTLLYRMLCCHSDLAWFSNVTDRWPSVPALAMLSSAYPLAALKGISTKAIPIPSEGYAFWNELTRLDGLPPEEPLDERDVSRQARTLASERIGAILRFQRKHRFVNKATRNVRRLPYVNALIDGAVFVNVLRDPRATVASLLKVAFWPDIPVWSEGNVTPRAWSAMGRDPTELAARLWASDVERALTHRETIPAERIVDVRYEDLVADTWGLVAHIGHSATLPLTEAFRRSCATFRVDDRNRSISASLTKAQLDTITRVAGPVAERVGYTW
jgi:hypothetical protein